MRLDTALTPGPRWRSRSRAASCRRRARSSCCWRRSPLGRTALGLALIAAFSVGLAGVVDRRRYRRAPAREDLASAACRPRRPGCCRSPPRPRSSRWALFLTVRGRLSSEARTRSPEGPPPATWDDGGIDLALNGSRIGLGCMPMSFGYVDAPSEDDPVRVIRRALELGVAMFDTADVYGPFSNEELVGEALEGRRRRRDDRDEGRAWWSARPGAIRSGAMRGPNTSPRRSQGSLRRLRTDVVDLYYLHRVDEHVPLEESLGRDGRRSSRRATSARSGSRRSTPISSIARTRSIPVAAVQSELSVWTRDALAEVVPWCAATAPPSCRSHRSVAASSPARSTATGLRRAGLPSEQSSVHRRGHRVEPGDRDVVRRSPRATPRPRPRWRSRGRSRRASTSCRSPGRSGCATSRRTWRPPRLALTAEDLAELDAAPPSSAPRY